MEWLTPKEPDTYIEAADLFRRLRARGLTIRSTSDCVIASLAARTMRRFFPKTAT
jgi:predicted nucleic acid-binding protein